MSGERKVSTGRRGPAIRRRPADTAKGDAAAATEAASTTPTQTAEKKPACGACEDCEASGHPPEPHRPDAPR